MLRMVFVGFDRKEEVVRPEGRKYSDILESLGINPETVVIVRNGTPVPVDDVAEDGEVRVIRVISGG